MAGPTLMAGKYGTVTAAQVNYALPPGNTTDPWNYIRNATIAAVLPIKNWELSIEANMIERTNTLSQVDQYAPSSYNGELSFDFFVPRDYNLNFWIGQLMDVNLYWSQVTLSGTKTKNFSIRVTISEIIRNLDVAEAYSGTIKAKINYNFEAGNTTFVYYYAIQGGEANNRGWYPLTPTITTASISPPWVI
jgi:hypothetical protein